MPSRSLSFIFSAGAAVLVGAGCGPKEPPRHPVVEVSERLTAKVELVSLVVADPVRAERVRAIYLLAAGELREYQAERARSVALLRRAWKAQAQAAPSEPVGSELFESLLAPPLDDGRNAFARYSRSMLEARCLLTESEFEKLDRVR